MTKQTEEQNELHIDAGAKKGNSSISELFKIKPQPVAAGKIGISRHNMQTGAEKCQSLD